ncbi:MAG: DUF305 domain-containing protein [Pseudonocardia sp. SCN 72-86]|nr:DUF305 domain-containing protein [uncultured Microbacterium sp.]ODU04699.1 MAG: DUF305 domain-containing protein [Pseudonocardia sp. SCN 72-86]
MKKIRTTALVAVPLAGALLLAGCADNGGSMPGMPGMGDGGSSASPSESAEADFNMADSMFAMMMIPHHQQAVEMSDMILAKSDVDQQVLDLAQQIKDAQQPEIDTMQGWLDDWGVSSDSMDMSGMDMGEDGMMSEDEMAALKAATGPAAAKMFLEQMIEHHKGAIQMAETELQDGKNADAKKLAQAVVDTQSAEITTMQELLTQL